MLIHIYVITALNLIKFQVKSAKKDDLFNLPNQLQTGDFM